VVRTVEGGRREALGGGGGGLDERRFLLLLLNSLYLLCLSFVTHLLEDSERETST